MSSSSLKVGKARIHRERAQPKSRERLGILEKHKDYVLRARDFKKKQSAIKRLKEKASNKNPDEFYYGMLGKKKGDQYTAEQMKLMKTQDVGYLTLKNVQEKKKVEKLQRNLHQIASKPVNKHTVFVDSEKEVKRFDAAEYFHTVPEAVPVFYNRPKVEDLESGRLVTNKRPAPLKDIEKERRKAYMELYGRQDRQMKIAASLQAVETEKKLLGKGKRRKVKDAVDGKPAVYKWDPIRKK
eukprot:TRINITY_DN32589_c0_g1_i1.p1 TRINITY_DN32589_c0_g1~~TRINITY_DN32589_c0_g1_i1.p1  ORF type:complete len:240 (+),score=44.73 TRINITY_DN32589_c0_g1_i1:33-752(+)